MLVSSLFTVKQIFNIYTSLTLRISFPQQQNCDNQQPELEIKSCSQARKNHVVHVQCCRVITYTLVADPIVHYKKMSVLTKLSYVSKRKSVPDKMRTKAFGIMASGVTRLNFMSLLIKSSCGN